MAHQRPVSIFTSLPSLSVSFIIDLLKLCCPNAAIFLGAARSTLDRLKGCIQEAGRTSESPVIRNVHGPEHNDVHCCPSADCPLESAWYRTRWKIVFDRELREKVVAAPDSPLHTKHPPPRYRPGRPTFRNQLHSREHSSARFRRGVARISCVGSALPKSIQGLFVQPLNWTDQLPSIELGCTVRHGH